MSFRRRGLLVWVALFCAALFFTAAAGADDRERALRESLHFHAPFDGAGDAKVADGDGRLLTADTLERKTVKPGIHRKAAEIATGAGRFGDCLRLTDRAPEVLLFPGTAMHYAKQDWSGTVSLWLKLTPDQDLKPGYCDPLQITEHAWNNGAFFVDFDKDLPRDFRLGVFSDLKHWNPQDIGWDDWPVDKRPMVTVKGPPFSRSDWTHVAFTFDHVNARDGKESTAVLYINGQSQGTLRAPLKFTWNPDRVAIMLGIEYIGDFDDLMIFRRALTPEEIVWLHQAKQAL